MRSGGRTSSFMHGAAAWVCAVAGAVLLVWLVWLVFRLAPRAARHSSAIHATQSALLASAQAPHRRPRRQAPGRQAPGLAVRPAAAPPVLGPCLARALPVLGPCLARTASLRPGAPRDPSGRALPPTARPGPASSEHAVRAGLAGRAHLLGSAAHEPSHFLLPVRRHLAPSHARRDLPRRCPLPHVARYAAAACTCTQSEAACAPTCASASASACTCTHTCTRTCTCTCTRTCTCTCTCTCTYTCTCTCTCRRLPAPVWDCDGNFPRQPEHMGRVAGDGLRCSLRGAQHATQP